MIGRIVNAGAAIVALSIACLVATGWMSGIQKQSIQCSSWNPNVRGTPTLARVREILDGKFKKLGLGDDTDNCSCCPTNLWKRTLPAGWFEPIDHKPTPEDTPSTHFVELDRLRVCELETSQDACHLRNSTIGVRHQHPRLIRTSKSFTTLISGSLPPTRPTIPPIGTSLLRLIDVGAHTDSSTVLTCRRLVR